MNGRCIVFHVKDLFDPLEYLLFEIEPKEEKFYFYVFEEAEEPSMIFNVYFNPVSLLTIEESSTSITFY